ncbi:MAG: PTS sugar transporter subunit IIA [Spirochaetales bacterium]|nr:PTS sugar transporter subunit IIA [Spirochaetales bacterium]
MKLEALLSEKTVVFFDRKAAKEKVIEELLQILWDHSSLKHENIPQEVIYSEFLMREKEQTTGIGEGFAFPHVRLNDLRGSYFLVAVCRNGIDFSSLDGLPVRFIILTIVPRLLPGILLSFRAAIVSLLMKPETQESMLNAGSHHELYEIIRSGNIDIDKVILAENIMRPSIGSVKSTMTLYEAARELHRHHVDSLPVFDENGNLAGKLSCHDLFAYRLPEFFNTLHSISFIKLMNPFEKYFEVDQSQKIGDLKLKQKMPIVKPDATIMEIIFKMTVENQELLYVVQDEKLLGIIDRFSIIDKILISNFDGAPS